MQVIRATAYRYTKLLQAQPIDLCCLGVGENGDLAFNDLGVANFQDPYFPIKSDRTRELVLQACHLAVILFWMA